MKLEEIRERLFALRDEKNAAFVAKLIPTIPADSILGVRTPALRKLAKELGKSCDMAAFLDTLPHAYFEENGLHAFLLAQIRDFDACLAAVERFLPFVDNWASCDSMSPPVFKRHRAELLSHVRAWLASPHPYTVRFGIKMLMEHFLETDYQPEILGMVSQIRSQEYYVNMMRAWFFATALVKQYTDTVCVLENRLLDRWTHNKTIQKAVESYRIAENKKVYLKSLRRKAEEV